MGFFEAIKTKFFGPRRFLHLTDWPVETLKVGEERVAGWEQNRNWRNFMAPAPTMAGYSCAGSLAVFEYRRQRILILQQAERILEEIRAAHYPDKPSHRRCMYLLDASANPNRFRGGRERTLIEVELGKDARIHRGVQGWLGREASFALERGSIDDLDISACRNEAHEYWAKEAKVGSDESEVLFEGSYMIVDIHLGGTGEKHMYDDTDGRRHVFKAAKNKLTGETEAFRAHVAAAFSNVARRIKPCSPDVRVVTRDGEIGVTYPFVVAQTLEGVSPQSLTASQRLDVATEHVLDWLFSQHDSSKRNLLLTAAGRVIGIDKEQCFRFFPPTCLSDSEQLSTSYVPNGSPPYYNGFWSRWSGGLFEFSFRDLGPVFDAIDAIRDGEYQALLRPYAESRWPGDGSAQSRFLQQALERKRNLKRDFREFFTRLREVKRCALAL